MSSIPDENVILEGSLKRCKKYKLFKTKWIEHYFILYCRDPGRNLYCIDEFKDSRKQELKKRFKLELVHRVESNLSMSDPSVLCHSGAHNHHPDTIHSIFGIAFRVHNQLKDLYLVAKSDEEMALWVNELCKICKLHRQNDDDESHADSSMSGLSMSSQSLDMSLIERQQFADNVSDPKAYLRMQHFKSINAQTSNPNYSNLPDTRSETSSMYSSRRTEDDSVSYTSGPPVPPPRARHITNRFIKVYQNGQINRLHMIPSSSRVRDGDDSSGETMKPGTSKSRTYPETLESFEGIPIYELNGREVIGHAPPPVDRSSKPRSMKGENEDGNYRNVESVVPRQVSKENQIRTDGNYKGADNKNYANRAAAKRAQESARRKNLDYFEPTQLVENSSSSTMAAASTRSPTPSDIEYISVDVDRTFAFKQLRRANQSQD